MKELVELNLPHDPAQLAYFRSLRDQTPNDAVIVEIGSYVGAIANQFVGGSRKVFSIDPWAMDDVFAKDDRQFVLLEDARDNRGGIDEIYFTWMKNAGPDLFVNMFPIKGFSQDIVKFWNLPIDLLYIDGCHLYESVKGDIIDWMPKVKKGGIIAGDDYGGEFWGVQKAVEELVPNFTVKMGNQWSAIV